MQMALAGGAQPMIMTVAWVCGMEIEEPPDP